MVESEGQGKCSRECCPPGSVAELLTAHLTNVLPSPPTCSHTDCSLPGSGSGPAEGRLYTSMDSEDSSNTKHPQEQSMQFYPWWLHMYLERKAKSSLWGVNKEWGTQGRFYAGERVSQGLGSRQQGKECGELELGGWEVGPGIPTLLCHELKHRKKIVRGWGKCTAACTGFTKGLTSINTKSLPELLSNHQQN